MSSPRAARQAAREASAFALAALLLYVPAMALPFLSTLSVGVRTPSTVLEGVVELTKEGSYFLAGLVFVASVVVPLGKIACVFILAAAGHGRDDAPRWTHPLERLLTFLGPWSMLDVFLLAIAASIFRFSDFMTVTPELGSLAFALVVVTTLAASERLRHARLRPDASERTEG